MNLNKKLIKQQKQVVMKIQLNQRNDEHIKFILKNIDFITSREI